MPPRVGGGHVGLLLSACVLVLVTGCGAHVPLPPLDASPDIVLEAYLQAQQVGDCDTARALQMTSDVGNLCGHISAWTTPRVANTLGGGIELSSFVTTVGGDSTFPDGRKGLNYQLRQRADGAWRVTGWGTGP
jgi:hypothetical protein